MTTPVGEIKSRVGAWRLTAPALLILCAAYLSHVGGPLRLSPDVVSYLSMAASAAEGNGFLQQGRVTQYPFGYPLLILLVERAGAGNAWGILGLNCVFLALGAAASYRVLREWLGLEQRGAALVCCLTLLSSVVINHTLLAMSDIVFFGLSMPFVLVLLRARQERGAKFWLRMAAAAALLLACLTVRTAGFALLPALLWTLLSRLVKPRSLFDGVRESRLPLVALAVVGCAALAVTSALLARTLYFRAALNTYAVEGPALLSVMLKFRAVEFGELAANVQVASLPSLPRVLFKCLGVAAFGGVLFALWSRRRQFGPVEVYVLSITLVVFFWPWMDARFWLPVLPLMMGLLAWVVRTKMPRSQTLKLLLQAYVAWFALAGVLALAWDLPKPLGGVSQADLDPETLSAVRRYSR